jgi:phosphinothricin acetyltransferase
MLDDKINKGFPVIVAELDGVVVGFGMVNSDSRS